MQELPGNTPAAGGAPMLGAISLAPESSYFVAMQFLFQEAELLDSGRFHEWLELLDDDLVYQVPVRATREDGDEHSTVMFHLDETRMTLQWRVERLDTEMAWAEGPPSRTRHFVSNIRVTPHGENELAVRSYLLLYRNRGSDARYDLLSGERQDLLRWRGDRWKLAKRLVLLDQVTLGTRNLAIFF